MPYYWIKWENQGVIMEDNNKMCDAFSNPCAGMRWFLVN